MLGAMHRGERPSPWVRVGVLLVATAIVGWVDHASGPDVGMSLFYILPVVVGAWYGTRNEALLIAIAAAGSWYAVDLSWHVSAHYWISTWNGVTRLVMYSAIGTLVSIVRRDRDALNAMNDRLQKALEHEKSISRTDNLTELPNSRALYEKLDRVLAASRSTKEPVCLALLDVDNFKLVNDVYGHATGDDLLKRIAGEIRAAVRSDDFAARIGGDEFLILFREIDPEMAAAVGQRIIDCIATIGNDFPEAALGASIGIALFTAAPASRDEIILRADNAMYEAKASGKRRVVIVSDAPPASDQNEIIV